MLRLEEFRPHFHIFLRHLENWLEAQSEAVDYQTHSGQFRDFLKRLQDRVEWELPLVSSFSEAQDLVEGFPDLFQDVLALLDSEEPCEDLQDALCDLREAVETLRLYQQNLPLFTDVQALNEILILSAQRGLSSHAFNPQALAQRLPLALAWLADTQASWTLFEQLFDHDQGLRVSRQARHALAGIKGGLGGLHLALESESGPEEVQEAGQVLVAALKALAHSEAARFKIEREAFGAPGDIHLQRLQYQHQRGLPLSTESKAELHSYFNARCQTMESLRLQGLCQEEPSEAYRTVDQRAAELSNLALSWQKLSQQASLDPQSLTQLLGDCERWEQDFRELQGPEKSEAPLDASLFEEVVVSKD